MSFQFSNMIRTMALAAIPALMLGFVAPSHADAIIEYGDSFLGVNEEGHLNVWNGDPGIADGEGGYGLWRRGIGDATYPGCQCEGWGVAITGAGGRTSAWASLDNGGIGGLDLGATTFTVSPTSATSTVDMLGAPVTISHAYGPSLAPDVFQGTVTITNNGGSVLSDLVYRRAMDWDVPPTEFDEFVTHGGVEANLESAGGNVRYASDDGFAFVDPISPPTAIDAGTVNVDFLDNGPNDHGSLFDFAFGDLAPGESRLFNIFYGTAANQDDALGAIATLGADVYSLGQSNVDGFGWCDNCTSDLGGSGDGTVDMNSHGEPATFLFAFGGVGGIEPGTDPSEPLLPFVDPEDVTVFEFDNPPPRRWFDPPFVDGFEYELVGADPTLEFTEVGAPPVSFGFGDVDLFIPGIGTVATLAPGDVFDFLGAGFTGVTLFSLIGIDPILDSADPSFSTAFPTWLDWAGDADSLLMVGIETSVPGGSVPEPGMIALMGLGLVGLMLVRRRRTVATFAA